MLWDRLKRRREEENSNKVGWNICTGADSIYVAE